MEQVDLKMLEKKMEDSCKVIEEAFQRFDPASLRTAWTGGKDSTLVLFLIKRVCDRNGMILPKCFNIDEGDMFPEIIDFIEKVKKSWGVEMEMLHNSDVSNAADHTLGAKVKVAELNERNRREIERLGYEESEFTYEPESFVGNHLMKTVTLNEYLETQHVAGFFEGIRWDEQVSRASEKYFSPREATPYSPAHMRICPILHFTERDVWNAHFVYEIPVCDLYAKGYRSLGARVSTTKLVDSPAWEQDLENTYERGGRRQDKEELMAKLRSLGYM